MKIQLKPKQVKMLIDKGMLKAHSMKLSGASAKNLGDYIKSNK